MKKYPVIVKVPAYFLNELKDCEDGRYCDAVAVRVGENKSDLESYKVVFNDFSDRFKSQIECRTDDELKELYYAVAAGTIGLHYPRLANRVCDEIRELVQEIDPKLVKLFPFNNGI